MTASKLLLLVEDYEEFEINNAMGIYEEEKKQEAQEAYWAFYDYCKDADIVWDLD
jgi:hypothetical protein